MCLQGLSVTESDTEATKNNAVVKKSQKKFTSMGEKGVVCVLRHLGILDLINVAQTNRFLKRCADSTILRWYQPSIDQLKITSPNDQFFRQFGHLVRHLVVACSGITKSDWNDKNLHILPTVADHCQKNLPILRLEQVAENLLTLNKADQEKVRKMFSGVKKLFVMDCTIIGWDKVMKSARIKTDTLSLEFRRADSWQEYVRKYQGLKSLYLSGLFSSELLDLNPTIKTVNISAESMSKNNLKNLGRLPNLKNVTIGIMGPRRDCNVTSTDFSALAKIPNLHYLYIITTIFYPMSTAAYISTLLALQHHKKLTELHFFSQFHGPITHSDPKQFKRNAFPNLKQLSIYGNFPFMSVVQRFESLKDIFVMESSTFLIQDFERFRSIIVQLPKLERIFFDVTADTSEASRRSLKEMCQSRTSQSKLMVLVQNYDNNIIQATMYPNTILMFSVYEPTVSSKPFVFDNSIEKAFDRAKLLAEKGEYVAIDYMDFCKGINSIDDRF